MGSTKSLKTPDGIDAIMVTKTRALVDAVYGWSRYNILPRAYRWIAETLKKSPAFKIKLEAPHYKASLNDESILKFTGYLRNFRS